jgi:hypothetical protein
MIALFIACEPIAPEVGSDNVFVLSGAEFTVGERNLVDDKMVAKGNVRNGGTSKFSPTWYVEAEFYRDSTFTYKLGGAQQSITFSLAPGEETGWELKFASTRFDLNQYPNFTIKNLRAIRPKE